MGVSQEVKKLKKAAKQKAAAEANALRAAAFKRRLHPLCAQAAVSNIARTKP